MEIGSLEWYKEMATRYSVSTLTVEEAIELLVEKWMIKN